MFARSARRKTERPPLTDAQLFEAAVSALATRSRSEAELRRLLTRKLDEPNRQRIDQVIARLHELGYLSDARLAENFVESRQKQSHLGRRRVAQELRRRGVNADLVEQTVERAYSEVDELQLALSFVEKKRLRITSSPGSSGSTSSRKSPQDAKAQKETARALRALQRAGFSLATCWKVVRHMGDAAALAGLEECSDDSVASDSDL